MKKEVQNRKELRKMKKFRFQLLHQWIVENFEVCKVADIGGGKGLLSYLLNSSGFKCAVIDPFYQELPTKYKDLEGGRCKIEEEEKVIRITKGFEIGMVTDFDLLIGLHSHGSNMKIIEAASKYNKSFIILPCCVIGEPIEKRGDINWFKSLLEYADSFGIETEQFELNFRGQNVGFYSKRIL